MMNAKDKLEGYFIKLGLTYQQIAEGTWVVTDDDAGVHQVVVVVDDPIVVVEYAERKLQEGVPKREAIAQAAESRLRPIIMTTVCTLLGFAPLAFGGGDGAEVRAPMAITVIGGLAVSTLLTLVVIPIVYDLMDRKPDSAYQARIGRADVLHQAALTESL